MAREGVASPELLADPDLPHWQKNLARGSRTTAEITLSRLVAFCESRKLTPANLALVRDKPLHDWFLDFVSSEEERGVAGSYIILTVKGAKSWLLHKGVNSDRPVKVCGAEETPSGKNERVPTQ